MSDWPPQGQDASESGCPGTGRQASQRSQGAPAASSQRAGPRLATHANLQLAQSAKQIRGNKTGAPANPSLRCFQNKLEGGAAGRGPGGSARTPATPPRSTAPVGRRGEGLVRERAGDPARASPAAPPPASPACDPGRSSAQEAGAAPRSQRGGEECLLGGSASPVPGQSQRLAPWPVWSALDCSSRTDPGGTAPPPGAGAARLPGGRRTVAREPGAKRARGQEARGLGPGLLGAAHCPPQARAPRPPPGDSGAPSSPRPRAPGAHLAGARGRLWDKPHQAGNPGAGGSLTRVTMTAAATVTRAQETSSPRGAHLASGTSERANGHYLSPPGRGRGAGSGSAPPVVAPPVPRVGLRARPLPAQLPIMHDPAQNSLPQDSGPRVKARLTRGKGRALPAQPDLGAGVGRGGAPGTD